MNSLDAWHDTFSEEFLNQVHVRIDIAYHQRKVAHRCRLGIHCIDTLNNHTQTTLTASCTCLSNVQGSMEVLHTELVQDSKVNILDIF